MNWKFSFKQNNSGVSRREILDNYEQKYLKKMDKIKSEIQKIHNKQKEIEIKELKDRIRRRLKLEKESGKDYKKLLLKTLTSKNRIKTNVESELKRKNKDEYSIQKRISETIKRISTPQKIQSTIAEDTRNFVRKRRTERTDDSSDQIIENKLVNKQIKKEEKNEKLKVEKFLRESEKKDEESRRLKVEAEKLLKENIKKTTFSGDSYQDFQKSKKKIVKPRRKKPKTEKEIKKEIAKLEEKLENNEKSDFVKKTLKTALSDGWTKTKTVEELRKSKERITIKKAKELIKETFENETKKESMK